MLCCVQVATYARVPAHVAHRTVYGNNECAVRIKLGKTIQFKKMNFPKKLCHPLTCTILY